MYIKSFILPTSSPRKITTAMVEVELQEHRNVELRSHELESALRRPRTTVTELRAFERCKFL